MPLLASHVRQSVSGESDCRRIPKTDVEYSIGENRESCHSTAAAISAGPACGWVAEEMSVLNDRIECLRNVVLKLEERLQDVLLPNDNGDCSMTEVAPVRSPLAGALANMAGRVSYLGDLVSGIIARLDI